MKGFKVLVKRGMFWHVFYAWAADEDAALKTVKAHLRAGVTVD